MDINKITSFILNSDNQSLLNPSRDIIKEILFNLTKPNTIPKNDIEIIQEYLDLIDLNNIIKFFSLDKMDYSNYLNLPDIFFDLESIKRVYKIFSILNNEIDHELSTYSLISIRVSLYNDINISLKNDISNHNFSTTSLLKKITSLYYIYDIENSFTKNNNGEMPENIFELQDLALFFDNGEVLEFVTNEIISIYP